MKWLNPVSRQELVHGYGTHDFLRLVDLAALEQDVREEAGAVGARQRERPEGCRLHDRERFFCEQQFAGLVVHQPAPELVGLRRELIAAPLPDVDHTCDAGEGFVDLAGERERRYGIHELEPVRCLDQLTRERSARELDGASAIFAETLLLDRAHTEQETGPDVVLVDALPLRLDDRVVRRVELARDDQERRNVFAELRSRPVYPFAQPQEQLGGLSGASRRDDRQHPRVGEHDVGSDSDIVDFAERCGEVGGRAEHVRVCFGDPQVTEHVGAVADLRRLVERTPQVGGRRLGCTLCE